MKIDIWSEGYIATGDHGLARFWKTIDAQSLQEATDLLARDDEKFRKHYDRNRMTWWGCRLFDNEEQARETFDKLDHPG